MFFDKVAKTRSLRSSWTLLLSVRCSYLVHLSHPFTAAGSVAIKKHLSPLLTCQLSDSVTEPWAELWVFGWNGMELFISNTAEGRKQTATDLKYRLWEMRCPKRAWWNVYHVQKALIEVEKVLNEILSQQTFFTIGSTDESCSTKPGHLKMFSQTL